MVGGGLLRWDFNPRYDRFGSFSTGCADLAAVRCLLFPESNLLIGWQRNDAKGHMQPHAAQQRDPLFDHLVGAGKECWRHDEPDGLRRLEIDDQFELSRLFDWQIAGFGSFSNLVGHYSRAPK